MSIPRIFDRRTYAQRRAKALGRDSFLIAEVADNLALRLSAVNRRFACALDLSSRDQAFALFAPLAKRWTRTALAPGQDRVVVADEEVLPFAPESFDLVVSVLSLHAVNDLPGALVQIRRVLKPDGLFLAALFAGGTLKELRAAFTAGEAEARGGASPRVSPFADVRDLGGLLQRAGFALPVADAETTTVHYGAFATLVDDLRAMGETNALAERAKGALRRDVLAATLSNYAALASDGEGRLTASFEIVYLTAWAPHESQQKPLRPGSAVARLSDALGVAEHRAGDSTKPHEA